MRKRKTTQKIEIFCDKCNHKIPDRGSRVYAQCSICKDDLCSHHKIYLNFKPCFGYSLESRMVGALCFGCLERLGFRMPNFEFERGKLRSCIIKGKNETKRLERK